MDRERLYIVGCGPGARDMLTLRAQAAIERATLCVGAERLIEEFIEDKHSKRLIVLRGNYSQALDEAEKGWKAGERVAFLVSGDPLLYSFGTMVIKRFGRENCEVVSGVSSLQYLFSLLKESWQGYRVLSLHGRACEADIKGHIERGESLAILLDGGQKLSAVRRELKGLDLSGYSFILASNLSLAEESIKPISPEEFDSTEVPSLSILVVRRDD